MTQSIKNWLPRATVSKKTRMNIRRKISSLFPTISYIKANRTLKEKIENPDCQSNSSYKANFDQISIDSFRQKYLEAFDTKNKFEDKAKTNVIGITIAITLITASSGMINTIINRFSFVWLHWTAFLSYYLLYYIYCRQASWP